MPGVNTTPFLTTPLRRTFTYCKPLVITLPKPENNRCGVQPKTPPRELNRLDSKNWTPTPREVEDHLIQELNQRGDEIDALILMDQVDVAETGVVTQRVLAAVGELAKRRPELRILGDSRRGLGGYPQVCLKMNRNELGALLGSAVPSDMAQVKSAAVELAHRHGRDVIVTLSEDGLLGATPSGAIVHYPCLPIRGEIDIVGAGDCVTANLTSALAAGASIGEALLLANAAASIVIHQLGTTGTASVAQIAETLGV
jgi:bifunctional ADP-heptose synthase (sugar kinase/adenylyltransferase)